MSKKSFNYSKLLAEKYEAESKEYDLSVNRVFDYLFNRWEDCDPITYYLKKDIFFGVFESLFNDLRYRMGFKAHHEEYGAFIINLGNYGLKDKRRWFFRISFMGPFSEREDTPEIKNEVIKTMISYIEQIYFWWSEYQDREEELFKEIFENRGMGCIGKKHNDRRS